MSCINDKNLLCHDYLLVEFKEKDRDGCHWGFIIHDGDCRTEYYDPSVATPVLSCHPKLIERTIEKLMKRNG